MIKRNNNTKPGKSSLAKVFLVLFSLICLFITGISVVSADDAVYSTVGGTWVKVNEKTWTMDKDGDGKTDVTLIKEGDEWRYIFNVADDSSMYYGWETDTPDGYQVENGYGTKENPAVSIQYAHTPNIDNDGVQNGNYTGGVDTNKVFSVPGSSTIIMKLTANLATGDYLVIWTGSHPDYTAAGDTAKGTKITGKVDTKEYTFNDNIITLGFHSEKDGEKGYGYYAVINSDKNQDGLMATNVATDEPIPDTGNLIVTKKVTESDGTESTDNNVFKFDIEFTSDNADTTAAIAEKKAYGDVTIENGKGSFYLSNGQQVKMTGLPAGISYKITEAENTDYEVSWTADSGVITKDAEATAICVNKKKPKEGYLDSHSSGTLTVGDDKYKLRFFAVLECEATEPSIFAPTENDDETLDYIKQNALFLDDNALPDKDEKILGLSTCKYPDTVERTLIFAAMSPESQ